jgi:isoleucyl-tRNA synthetase
MVNPNLTYSVIQVTYEGKSQEWILASSRVQNFLSKVKVTTFQLIQEFSGRTLENEPYIHPLYSLQKPLLVNCVSKNIHTVLLSSEFVSDTEGTGLVHCAPGCGPEDYVVGYQYGLNPLNTVDERGFLQGFGGSPLAGLQARKDDGKFIEIFESSNFFLFVKIIHFFFFLDKISGNGFMQRTP